MTAQHTDFALALNHIMTGRWGELQHLLQRSQYESLNRLYGKFNFPYGFRVAERDVTQLSHAISVAMEHEIVRPLDQYDLIDHPERTAVDERGMKVGYDASECGFTRQNPGCERYVLRGFPTIHGDLYWEGTRVGDPQRELALTPDLTMVDVYNDPDHEYVDRKRNRWRVLPADPDEQDAHDELQWVAPTALSWEKASVRRSREARIIRREPCPF